MGRSALHVEVSNWLAERIGQIFPRGSEEWQAMVLLFEERPKWSVWVASSAAFRVVRNDRGHPGTEFLASPECVAPEGEEPCVAGKWYPLSWARCFAPKQDVTRRRLMTAMRAAVQGQIDAFRARVPVPAVCPVTGRLIGGNPQVDHVAPATFAALADEFISRFGSPALRCDSATCGPRLVAPASWVAFHGDRAKLRWVSVKGNQLAKKGK